ncbi:MAG: Fe-S protein assembly chaperone HscA [Tepidisphaera sp.]
MSSPSANPASAPQAREPIVGIDLGTTNSLVAWYDASGPRVLDDAQGRSMLPSVVRFGEGDPVVGHDAKLGGSPGSTTIASVKRLMGRSKADAAADLPFLGYTVVDGPNNTARVQTANGTVTPQEVSAIILRTLKATAERALGFPIGKAVVTVPAYFDDAQRQATRDAGRLAGLDVVRIVNEPTAAALAYGLGTLPPGSSTRTVAVYDFGGGTFDVSILRLTPSEQTGETAFFQVLSTAGDTHLGGDDVDHLIVELFAKDLAARGEPSPDADRKRALQTEAERVKVALSEVDQTQASLPAGSGAYTRVVTRAELEALIAPLIDRTIASCRRALADAKVASVDAVVLVGGSTRIPAVRRAVAACFGIEPYTAIDPDRAVALGAAVQAGVLSGAASGALLLDVIPLSLGIETAGGAVAKIVMRNSTVPTRAREMFSTQVDNQTAIKLHIVQGEREMVENCRSLGTFHLRGLPPMPAGLPQVEVEFLVDASGVLQVSAQERRSGRRAQLQVVPNHGLTREEVDRIERESFSHAREDMKRHRVVDLIVNAKLDLRWIKDRFDKFGDRLDVADRTALETMITDLRAMVERAERDWTSVDPNAMQKLKELLDRGSMRLQEISITESLKRDAKAGP